MNHDKEVKSLMDIRSEFEHQYENAIIFFKLFKRFAKPENLNAGKYLDSANLRIEKSAQSVKSVFKSWPPQKIMCVVTDENKILRTQIYFDAFIINCYGAIDNIAHFWNQAILSGKFQNNQVGIMPNNKRFKNQLPCDLKKIPMRIFHIKNFHLRTGIFAELHMSLHGT